MTREAFLAEHYIELTSRGINQEVASGMARAMADGMHRRMPKRVRAMLNNDLIKAYRLFAKEGEVEQLHMAMKWIMDFDVSLPLKTYGVYSKDVFCAVLQACSLYSRLESTVAPMAKIKKIIGRTEYDTGRIYSELEAREAAMLSRAANRASLLSNKTRDVNVVIIQGAEEALAIRIPLRGGETIKAQIMKRSEVRDFICSYKGWSIEKLKNFRKHEMDGIRKAMDID